MNVLVRSFVVLALAVSSAHGQTDAPPATGDPNRDGVTNILDVQGAIAQALGAAELSTDADVDGDAEVNVFDVQHLVNTTLGVGGLVQRVRGVVDCACDAEEIRVIAIARDGRRAMAVADPETGAFELVLRARTAWSFGVCARLAGQTDFRCIGTVDFPVGDGATAALPLVELARGEVLDLGVLRPENGRIRVTTHLLRLLVQLDRPFDPVDENENGVPDFIEPLLRRVELAEPPEGFDIEAFLRHVGVCIAENAEAIERPSLVNEDGDAIPDFVETPYLACFNQTLPAYLEAETDVRSQELAPTVIRLRAAVLQGIPEWLRSLDFPQLIDTNMNGIPDRIEAFLVRTQGESTRLDRDGNLVPDFLDDHDGDGVPNIFDEDWRTRADADDPDGDGIPNDEDVDDDNDGVPDYADTDGITPADRRNG